MGEQSLTAHYSEKIECTFNPLIACSQANLDCYMRLINSAERMPLDACYQRIHNLILEVMTYLFRFGFPTDLCSSFLAAIDCMFNEHFMCSNNSRLKLLIPDIGSIFTPLPFSDAFKIYDDKYQISKRRFVSPSANEIRHIINIAQILAMKSKLRLISFDGDKTLYPNGENFSSIEIAFYISTMLKNGLYVAIVTAAGYGYQCEKYEIRLGLLLDFFKCQQLPIDIVKNFVVLGGESNYLLRCGSNYKLEPMPEKEWAPYFNNRMARFFVSNTGKPSKAAQLLSIIKRTLEDFIVEFQLCAMVIVKERAIGLVPDESLSKKKNIVKVRSITLKSEILDEAVFRVRHVVKTLDPPLHIPYCAFNGGIDMWVDIGNKAEGLLLLQSLFHISPDQSLHIGDQFSASGNDAVAQYVSPTLWITNPSETSVVARIILKQMNLEHSDLNACSELYFTTVGDDASLTAKN